MRSRNDDRHTLYRLFDLEGQLLYVGITRRPIAERLIGHYSRPWWPLVASRTETVYPSRTDALRAEATAICDERPVHNIYQTERMPGRGPRAVQARCPVCCSLRSLGNAGRFVAHWSVSVRCPGSGRVPEPLAHSFPESDRELIRA